MPIPVWTPLYEEESSGMHTAAPCMLESLHMSRSPPQHGSRLTVIQYILNVQQGRPRTHPQPVVPPSSTCVSLRLAVANSWDDSRRCHRPVPPSVRHTPEQVVTPRHHHNGGHITSRHTSCSCLVALLLSASEHQCDATKKNQQACTTPPQPDSQKLAPRLSPTLCHA